MTKTILKLAILLSLSLSYLGRILAGKSESSHTAVSVGRIRGTVSTGDAGSIAGSYPPQLAVGLKITFPSIDCLELHVDAEIRGKWAPLPSPPWCMNSVRFLDLGQSSFSLVSRVDTTRTTLGGEFSEGFVVDNPSLIMD